MSLYTCTVHKVKSHTIIHVRANGIGFDISVLTLILLISPWELLTQASLCSSQVPCHSIIELMHSLPVSTAKVHSISAVMLSIPAQVHSVPACMSSTPVQVHSVPVRMLSIPAQVHSIPACMSSTPVQVHSVPVWMLSIPAQAYISSIPAQVHSVLAGMLFIPAQVHSVLASMSSIPAQVHSVSASMSSIPVQVHSVPAWIQYTPYQFKMYEYLRTLHQRTLGYTLHNTNQLRCTSQKFF